MKMISKLYGKAIFDYLTILIIALWACSPIIVSAIFAPTVVTLAWMVFLIGGTLFTTFSTFMVGEIRMQSIINA